MNTDQLVQLQKTKPILAEFLEHVDTIEKYYNNGEYQFVRGRTDLVTKIDEYLWKYDPKMSVMLNAEDKASEQYNYTDSDILLFKNAYKRYCDICDASRQKLIDIPGLGMVKKTSAYISAAGIIGLYFLFRSRKSK